jgi:hypothetical protein
MDVQSCFNLLAIACFVTFAPLKNRNFRMIKINFPDGAVREYAAGSSALDIARSISEGLARKVLAASVNGEL